MFGASERSHAEGWNRHSGRAWGVEGLGFVDRLAEVRVCLVLDGARRGRRGDVAARRSPGAAEGT